MSTLEQRLFDFVAAVGSDIKRLSAANNPGTPYEVMDGESFVVTDGLQLLYSQPIELHGNAMLDLAGLLVEVS